ncbi:hydroxyacylglutathione hydrolase [Tieghemostelium lacteum]|uniref:hydroxyacylglutathione hydrolase n=1 Tax=Tieghemostelium lacteum TaxID=361077 RepID=A0A152A0B8_TIELA|nr:hydroxyacylglutathione hydrolase [Tieghemostelium lacteum]|eukprot:KYQ99687.1 hydroxyacylglutathione hydrolase [Tieghemostelium lacteum]
MKVITIPTLNDNYSYLLINENQKIAAAIDPVEPKKVIDAAKAENVEIKMILTTHHHMDHAGGNESFQKLLPVPCYGGDERVLGINQPLLIDQHQITLGDISIRVLKTPGHTTGHVLYLARDEKDESGKDQVLFTGDTLFISGCGRIFEGTAEQMNHALNSVIAVLPETTKIYCGHEYTLKNLEFALTIEPDNQAIRDKIEWTKKQRASNLPTVPSTVAQEKSYNPFMRVHLDNFKQLFSEYQTPIDILVLPKILYKTIIKYLFDSYFQSKLPGSDKEYKLYNDSSFIRYFSSTVSLVNKEWLSIINGMSFDIHLREDDKLSFSFCHHLLKRGVRISNITGIYLKDKQLSDSILLHFYNLWENANGSVSVDYCLQLNGSLMSDTMIYEEKTIFVTNVSPSIRNIEIYITIPSYDSFLRSNELSSLKISYNLSVAEYSSILVLCNQLQAFKINVHVGGGDKSVSEFFIPELVNHKSLLDVSIVYPYDGETLLSLVNYLNVNTIIQSLVFRINKKLIEKSMFPEIIEDSRYHIKNKTIKNLNVVYDDYKSYLTLLFQLWRCNSSLQKMTPQPQMNIQEIKETYEKYHQSITTVSLVPDKRIELILLFTNLKSLQIYCNVVNDYKSFQVIKQCKVLEHLFVSIGDEHDSAFIEFIDYEMPSLTSLSISNSFSQLSELLISSIKRNRVITNFAISQPIPFTPTSFIDILNNKPNLKMFYFQCFQHISPQTYEPSLLNYYQSNIDNPILPDKLIFEYQSKNVETNYLDIWKLYFQSKNK